MRNALKRDMASPRFLAELTGAREPGDEPLGVKGEVAGEGVLELATGQAAAVTARERAPQRQHIGADASLRVGVGGVCARHAGELGDLLLERGTETRDVGHAAEVHQVYRFGPVREHAV